MGELYVLPITLHGFNMTILLLFNLSNFFALQETYCDLFMALILDICIYIGCCVVLVVFLSYFNRKYCVSFFFFQLAVSLVLLLTTSRLSSLCNSDHFGEMTKKSDE